MAGLTRRTLTASIVSLIGPPAFARGGQVKIPFALTHNVPSTAGTVNGRAAGPLLISTGHAWVTFERQILQNAGAVEAGASWADTALGRRQASFYGTDRIVLDGRLTLNDYYVASLPPGTADPDFQGVVGGLFGRRAAMFDFDARTLMIGRRSQFTTEGFRPLRSLGGPPARVSETSTFSRWGPVTHVAFEWNALFDRRPIVKAVLDGRELRLLLDTGFGGAVLLYGEGRQKAAPDGQAWLFGEGPATRIERASQLELGGIRLKDPVVEYVQDGVQPHHSAKTIDGIVGMEVLRRTQLLLDLGREEVMLKPNAALNDPFDYNRSGMSLTKVGRDILVARVTSGAPAWRAGLRPGDKLVRWDGAASLRGLSQRFSRPPGARADLIAQRGERTAAIHLVLEELA